LACQTSISASATGLPSSSSTRPDTFHDLAKGFLAMALDPGHVCIVIELFADRVERAFHLRRRGGRQQRRAGDHCRSADGATQESAAGFISHVIHGGPPPGRPKE
jgi:hypothetical protein